MKIDKENIECFIFDYHEGNLSDSDKAEVLNFIHQHPEYENDFAHWAQSYFHADDPIKNYDLADTLVQNHVIPWYMNKWLISGVFFVFAIGLYSFFLFSPTEKHNIIKESTSIVTVKNSTNMKTAPPSQINSTSTNKTTNNENVNLNQNVRLNKNTTPSKKMTVTELSEPKEKNTLSTIADTLTNPKIDCSSVNNPPQISGASKVNVISKIDTIQSNASISENNEAKVKKTPSKQKSGLNLKPQNKFIPTNPDF